MLCSAVVCSASGRLVVSHRGNAVAIGGWLSRRGLTSTTAVSSGGQCETQSPDLRGGRRMEISSVRWCADAVEAGQKGGRHGACVTSSQARTRLDHCHRCHRTRTEQRPPPDLQGCGPSWPRLAHHHTKAERQGTTPCSTRSVFDDMTGKGISRAPSLRCMSRRPFMQPSNMSNNMPYNVRPILKKKELRNATTSTRLFVGEFLCVKLRR